MTRAFGDEVGATIGIVPDPEITQVWYLSKSTQ